MFSYIGAAVLGWGLGANDSANVFGTAVSSKMVRYRNAVILIAVFVILGAWSQGEAGIETLKSISATTTKNAVIASVAAAMTVLLMTILKLPISTSQAVVGGILGVSILRTGESTIDFIPLLKILICWVTTPFGGAFCSIIFYYLFRGMIRLFKPNIILTNEMIKIGLIICGCYGAYALGANNVANVSAVYVASGMMNASAAVLIGGILIALGALTFSRRVMTTVGTGIVRLDAFSAFIAVLAHAVTVHVYAIIGVPVSTSQAIVGAVFGIGLIKGLQTVRFNIFTRVLFGWVLTPAIAAGVALLIHLCCHISVSIDL